jgi:hypothetical protein
MPGNRVCSVRINLEQEMVCEADRVLPTKLRPLVYVGLRTLLASTPDYKDNRQQPPGSD